MLRNTTKLIIYFVDLRLIDLRDGGRFLYPEHAEKIKIRDVNFNSMGFLPSGDLILVSLNYKLRDYKIYLYSAEDKPITNTTLWKCSQMYDIEFTETLKDDETLKVRCFIDQTKLFIVNEQLMIQWNLLKMTFDIQYFVDHDLTNVVINKDQTLLALKVSNKIDVFSIETGVHISSYG